MAAKVMTKTYAGVLPTLHNSNLYPERLDYFNHFINLKCVDFFYGKALEKLQDHEKKVIIYCQTGKRAAAVTFMLHKQYGLKNIFNLAGGYSAYLDSQIK